ncbi:MAG: LysR family transcriptional regulator [Methylocystaceae bacterium]|nr:LysR family transcriptional regulator [Methylocystaceae bacterium]
MKQIFSTIDPDEGQSPLNRTFNLDALRSFVAICETGTFRRAASRVHRSPSAISLQIAKLEEQVGAKLMTRDARHIRLSEQGELLLRYARRLLGISDEAMALFQGSPLSGHLRLAAPQDLGVSLVPGILQKLAVRHPAIVVEVRLGASDMVQNMFAKGEVNVALFNEVTDPSLKVLDLFSEPLVWLMREGGRAIERTPLPLATASIGCAWRDAALQALEDHNKPYRVAYYSDTSMGQIAALRADLAIAALPKSLVNAELIEVPKDYLLPALPKTHIYLADDGSNLAQALSAVFTAG